MGYLDKLKSIDPKGVFAKYEKKAASTRKHPRERLIEAIDHSLSYLADDTYRVKNKKGEDIVPDLCYEVDGSEATIILRYARTPLKLDGKSEAFKTGQKNVKKVLEALREGAEAGEFDKQIEAIKDKRVSAMSQGKAAKK